MCCPGRGTLAAGRGARRAWTRRLLCLDVVRVVLDGQPIVSNLDIWSCVLRSDQLRILRDAAVAQRDDTLSELATAYADMDALQATLSDSAVYVRYLRKRVLELELEQSRNAAFSILNNSMPKAQQQLTKQEGAFSLDSIKAAIETAVEEACGCPEDERKKRIRQLQLRWHPDKVREGGRLT